MNVSGYYSYLDDGDYMYDENNAEKAKDVVVTTFVLP